MSGDIIHGKFPNGVDGKAGGAEPRVPDDDLLACWHLNAAKEYLRFMMEREQYVPWQEASIAATCPIRSPATNRARSGLLTRKSSPYRDFTKDMRNNGYAGEMGYASVQCSADFIIANMVAEAASGAKTPKEAMDRAAQRAERHYKI